MTTENGTEKVSASNPSPSVNKALITGLKEDTPAPIIHFHVEDFIKAPLDTISDEQLRTLLVELTLELESSKRKLTEARTKFISAFDEYGANADALCSNLDYYASLSTRQRQEVDALCTAVDLVQGRIALLKKEHRQRSLVYRFSSMLSFRKDTKEDSNRAVSS